ncbi:hypothetical protein OAM67_01825 [bacterium]|nr:hypothetical protein [bacterium]
MKERAIAALRQHGTAKTVWEAVVSKDAPHYRDDERFVWRDPAHDSVTGDGWSMDL